MIRSGFGKRVGNRWEFALEFEIQSDTPRVWNESLGSLWLWEGGRLIGNPYETEMVKTGLDSLWEAALEDRAPASRTLSTCTHKEAFEAVMWARYGEDHEPFMRMTPADQESLVSLEVLPRRTGPFFDGWEAILFQDGTGECLIYREDATELVEAVLPIGTFRRVVTEAAVEFEKLARLIAKRTTSTT